MNITLAIPCFNEERRLPLSAVHRLVRESTVRVLLVDDGSTDGTLGLLERLRAWAPERIELLVLRNNRGKAEAVRQALRVAVDGADVVGYADADFATPPEELLRLARVIENSGAGAVLGSRLAILGAHIERDLLRRCLGRAFAAGASLALGKPLHDVQCGAKLFRVSDALRSAIASPFRSRWAFDVELLGRVWAADRACEVIEVPLRRWVDVGGSKLRAGAMVRSGLELAWIANDLRRLRRSVQ